MLKVAITGNIGSGKSTVTKIFQSLGIPVFVADAEARKLYKDDGVKQEVTNLFGDHVYHSDGSINKTELANVIFSDPVALSRINKIIHPRTLNKYQEWLELHQDRDYTIHESAILFENKLNHHFDKTIVVTAPIELRIKRVMKRDGVSYGDVFSRMKNQLADEEKNKLADYLIVNDGKQFLIPQVVKLNKILKLI